MLVLERLKIHSSLLFETLQRDICICENEETASANVFFFCQAKWDLYSLLSNFYTVTPVSFLSLKGETWQNKENRRRESINFRKVEYYNCIVGQDGRIYAKCLGNCHSTTANENSRAPCLFGEREIDLSPFGGLFHDLSIAIAIERIRARIEEWRCEFLAPATSIRNTFLQPELQLEIISPYHSSRS